MDQDTWNAIRNYLPLSARNIFEVDLTNNSNESDGQNIPESDSETSCDQESDSSSSPSSSDGELNQNAPRGRKRKRQVEKWRVNIRKTRKASGLKHKMHKRKESEPTRYRKKKERKDLDCLCAPKCSTKFTEKEKEKVFRSFYELKDHTLQNCSLRGMIEDKGQKIMSNGKSRKTFIYRIALCGRSEIVCKKYFLGIHDILPGRLEAKVLRKDVSILDGRGKHGKHRKVHEDIINGVKEFISDLPKRQSHYSLKDNGNVGFLDSTWNCNRLYIQYLQQNRNNANGFVKADKFRRIFNYDFNLKFGYPRSDKCSKCEDVLIKIRMEMKSRRPSEKEIESLNQDLRAHQVLAQRFYDSIRSSKETGDDVFSFCMDFGSNMALPVTNVGEEYYLRQLWLHNLAFHNLKSRVAHMFIYSEHFAGKGPDEVISALKYYVDKCIPCHIRKVQIFADNCAAHNKNTTLLLAIQGIVNQRFDELTIQYAEVGHSRMAADSDFGKIVMRKKKYEFIYGPSDWVKIIEESNLVNPFQVVYLEKPCTDNLTPGGKDVVRVLNFKDALKAVMNPSVHGIKKVRKLQFLPNNQPIIVSSDSAAMDGSVFPILKARTSSEDLKNAFLKARRKYQSYCELSSEKVANVKSLLTHSVMKGRENFYNTIPGMVPSKTRGNK